MGTGKIAHKVLVGRPEGKRLLGRCRRRQEYENIYEKWSEEAWTGLIWRRMGTGGGRL
jgi:hypothetical protein